MQVEMIIEVESRCWIVEYKYARNDTKISLINRLSQYYFYHNHNWTRKITRKRLKWVETIIHSIHYGRNKRIMMQDYIFYNT